MTDVLLEVDEVTKHFPSPRHRVQARGRLRESARRRLAGCGAARRQDRRRVGLREVDARACDAAARADRQRVSDGQVRGSQQGMRSVRRELPRTYASLNPRKRVGFLVSEPLEVRHRHGVGAQAARAGHLLEVVGLNPDTTTASRTSSQAGSSNRRGTRLALNRS